MNVELRTIATAYSVFREGDNPLLGETATRVRLDDEASGLIVLEQMHEDIKPGQLTFDLDELEAVLVAARQLMLSTGHHHKVLDKRRTV